MKNTIKRIGIIAKTHAPAAPEVAPALNLWLKQKGYEVFVDTRTAELGLEGATIAPPEKLGSYVDLIVVLGGDGTLIGMARNLGKSAVPVLAVNLGSLGFLSVVTQPRLYLTMERVLAGEFSTSERFLLDVELRPLEGEPRKFHVLNDAVVNKAALARIIKLSTFIDGLLLTNYLADGLIIATPTGSTAYSLSAGGPILFPTTEAIVVSPICPHQLTNRSVVFPSTVQVEVILQSEDQEVTLTLDGQIGIPMHYKDRILVTRSDQTIRLVTFPETDFFDVWRRKLHWGRREDD